MQNEIIYGCTDPNASNYNASASMTDMSCKYETGLYLRKEIYGHKDFEKEYDTEIKELLVQDFQIGDFFGLYKRIFYEIPKKGIFSHKTIIDKSTEYINGFTHPKTEEINNLYFDIKTALEKLYSIENKHSILENNSVLRETNDVSSPFNINDTLYYIQSFKKRKIIGNEGDVANNRFTSKADILIKIKEINIIKFLKIKDNINKINNK